MPILLRKPLSRRTCLRGAGVSLGLPLLDAMAPRRGHAALPVRLLVFFWPHGSVPGQYAIGKTGDITAADLSPATQTFRGAAGSSISSPT